MSFEVDEMERVAYAMEAAYKRELNLGDAVHSVSEQFPELDTSTRILSAMWLAINAYVDINPSQS